MAKDFNEHIKEGNILTDGDQYIMKKLIKEIVVKGRKPSTLYSNVA